MTESSERRIADWFESPVNRRSLLSLGLRGAAGLYGVLGTGTAAGLVSLLTGCYRAPGTARDQLIFFSEEKELQFGMQAYREVLREARLSENPEITEMV